MKSASAVDAKLGRHIVGCSPSACMSPAIKGLKFKNIDPEVRRIEFKVTGFMRVLLVCVCMSV